MASIREQILATFQAVLTSAAPGGAKVFRSREVSLARSDAPAIVIMAGDTETQRFSKDIDQHIFECRVEIFVRGDPWTQLVDAVDVPAHAAIMGSAALRALVTDVRRLGETFESMEADRTSGVLTARYRLIYLTYATAIDRAG